MNFRNLSEFDNHSLVVDLGKPKNSSIRGFVAIHNNKLGPALGGTRVFNYKTENQALKDVLRLSRAMTYKCAIAGLPFGGGKGVIIADPATTDMQKVLKEYALQIKKLAGRFYTGEDVGLSESQVQYMLQFSPYFIGKTGFAGDPSKYAALSVFLCIQVALKRVFGTSEISGRSFAIKGVGKTGSELAWFLAKSGGKVYVSDLDATKIALLSKLDPKIKGVDVTEIQSKKVDVYAPCALGNDLDLETVKKLRVKIVAGTANNQLASDTVSNWLYQADILHVPDYIANAGGLINVADELLSGGYNKSRVLKNINKLKKTLQAVLDESAKIKENPDIIADQMAEEILKKGSRRTGQKSKKRR
jgi:leucine dehydrogenase